MQIKHNNNNNRISVQMQAYGLPMSKDDEQAIDEVAKTIAVHLKYLANSINEQNLYNGFKPNENYMIKYRYDIFITNEK